MKYKFHKVKVNIFNVTGTISFTCFLTISSELLSRILATTFISNEIFKRCVSPRTYVRYGRHWCRLYCYVLKSRRID